MNLKEQLEKGFNLEPAVCKSIKNKIVAFLHFDLDEQKEPPHYIDINSIDDLNELIDIHDRLEGKEILGDSQYESIAKALGYDYEDDKIANTVDRLGDKYDLTCNVHKWGYWGKLEIFYYDDNGHKYIIKGKK
jgi:hypothetical protein